MTSWWGGHTLRTCGVDEDNKEKVHALEEGDWRRLHGDHFVSATMVHKCGKMGLCYNMEDLNQWLKNCRVCTRHVFFGEGYGFR